MNKQGGIVEDQNLEIPLNSQKAFQLSGNANRNYMREFWAMLKLTEGYDQFSRLWLEKYYKLKLEAVPSYKIYYLLLEFTFLPAPTFTLPPWFRSPVNIPGR